MSTMAKLYIGPSPEPAEGAKRYTLDGEHRTTRLRSANAPPPGPQLTDRDTIRAALLEHYAKERRGCSRLWHVGRESGELPLMTAGGPP